MTPPDQPRSHPPTRRNRSQRRDIAGLYTVSGKYFYDLNPERKQFFCETPAAWELWDETEELRRVRRWPKKRIGFVIPKPVKSENETSALPLSESEPSGDAFQNPFYRARRTLLHLWHITLGQKDFNPEGCDGCKEISQFLIDADFRGDEFYPIGETIDPDWKLDSSEIELAARALKNRTFSPNHVRSQPIEPRQKSL